MKKQFLVVCAILTMAIGAQAQKEFKLAKSSGQLNLNISGAIVEGYSGNEIIFSIPKSKREEVDERAKGLRVISGSGFVDNTGLGLDVSTKGDEVNVNSIGNSNDRDDILTIKVPQNMKVSFTNTSTINQSTIFLKNLKGEIEVAATYNKVKLENNTGPMNIKTIYGTVDATFSGEVKGPVSILSVYDYVDVTLPPTAKTNIELGTNYGKLYAAEGLKIDIDKNTHSKSQSSSESDSNMNFSSTRLSGTINSFGRSTETIKGKINGGGADLILKSNYKNVYLREK